MRKLSVFNFMTLNGYFKGAHGAINWHKDKDPEKDAFSAESMKSGNTLLFGRMTYEMMASFWPTPAALEQAPALAEGMNNTEKIVFSRTLKKAGWNNTRIIKDDLVEEIRRLKQGPGKDMTLLGSGSILTQLAEQGLIDDYLFMVDPVAIGDGTPIFKGIGKELRLKLTMTKTFKSGVILLCYQPKGD
jgi:dihydrofolate reductase